MTDEWGGYRSWSEEAVVRGGHLITPARFLWVSYVSYCREWGFQQASAAEFMGWLRDEEGVRLAMAGSGRIRRMVIGLAPFNGVGTTRAVSS